MSRAPVICLTAEWGSIVRRVSVLFFHVPVKESGSFPVLGDDRLRKTPTCRLRCRRRSSCHPGGAWDCGSASAFAFHATGNCQTEKPFSQRSVHLRLRPPAVWGDHTSQVRVGGSSWLGGWPEVTRLARGQSSQAWGPHPSWCPLPPPLQAALDGARGSAPGGDPAPGFHPATSRGDLGTSSGHRSQLRLSVAFPAMPLHTGVHVLHEGLLPEHPSP